MSSDEDVVDAMDASDGEEEDWGDAAFERGGLGKRRRGARSKEEAIYGIFADDSDEEPPRGGGRGGRGERGGAHDYAQPVAFRSAGRVEGKDDDAPDDDDANAATDAPSGGVGARGGLGAGLGAGGGGGGLGFEGGGGGGLGFAAAGGGGLGFTGGGLGFTRGGVVTSSEMPPASASSGGLGFVSSGGPGPGDARGSEDPKEPEAAASSSDDEDLLPSSFGQRVMRNAAQRRADAEAALEEKRRLDKERLDARERERVVDRGGRSAFDAPSRADRESSEVGAFEKHTRGIGMKLLQKMGYKKGGGLGKDGRGMSKPMETKMRPKAMGMGYGDFKEAGQLNRDLSEDLKPSKETPSEPLGSADEDGAERAASRAQQAHQRAMWKRRDELRRSRREYKTAEEVLAEKEKEELEAGTTRGPAAKPMTVIDMRGSQARVVTNLSRLESDVRDGSAGASDASDAVPFPELQHNLRLVVDLAEAEIQTADAKIRHERDTREILARERRRLKAHAEALEAEAENVAALVADAEKCESMLASDAATLEDVAEMHKNMRASRRAAYDGLGLRRLALSHAAPLVARLFANGWDPLRDPTRGAEAVAKWRGALGDDGETDAAEGENDAATAALLAEAVIQPARAALANRWDATDPEPALRFFDAWVPRALPAASTAELLSGFVAPKLGAALEAWDPSSAKKPDDGARKRTAPPHTWLHPWLPLMRESMAPLWAPVRHKLAAALADWHPSDPAFAIGLLAPWRSVFQPRDWAALLSRSVLPKLEFALGELAFPTSGGEPAADREPVRWFSAWERHAPVNALAATLEAAFFPRWHDALHAWLRETAPRADLEEVTRWYLGWKAEFGEELLAHERVRRQLNVALDMMNQAAGGDPGGVRPPPANAEAAAEAARGARRAAREEKEPEPRKAKPTKPDVESDDEDFFEGGNGGMTLREAVEAFAASHEVPFLPKPGREHGGLRVWAFGDVSATIDQKAGAIRARVEGRWAPVSLDQLLEMHRAKARAKEKAF